MNPGNRPSPDPAALLRAALPGDEAAPWQPPTPAKLAPRFPELAIEECIGQGGMAAVYRATQTRLGRTVALKVMRPDLAAAPEFTERFVREAKALAALANPHVLAIHDFGERDGCCYLVTEYVDGANLRELMRLGRLSPGEVLRIVPQICAGLAFAHQHGVVHRDIKPENVLVDRGGQVKLADFGLAKLAGERGGTAFTRSGQVFGTPHYMAPEQWQGSAAVDHRADIYSLGVVLYELLTGKLPVGAYPPASAQPGVPLGVDQVVQRSLQQEPEHRYQSVREVQRDLERERAPAAELVQERAAVGPVSAAGLLVGAVSLLLLGSIGLAAWGSHEEGIATCKQVAMHKDASNGALMAAVRATVSQGQAWAGALPEPVAAMPRGELPIAMRVVFVAGSGLALFVLALVLTFRAWQRTRHVGTSRLQNAIAGGLLGIAVISPIGGCLAWSANEYFGNHGLTRFLSMLVVFAASIALVRWVRRTSANRLPGSAAPMGKTAASLTLGSVVLLLAVVLAQTFVDREPAWQPRSRLPVLGMELVGQSRAVVLARLGPPLSIEAARDSMSWGYRGLDGQQLRGAVSFTSGVVTASQHPAALLVPEVLPATGAYAGQTVDELVQALGPATSTSSGELGGSLQFADGTTATVVDGVVVRVTK